MLTNDNAAQRGAVRATVAQTPEFLQSVMDNPDVKRWISQDHEMGEIPLAAIFDQGIGLEFPGGGFFFHRLGDGVYEVHTVFLPGSKGVAEACQAAAVHMFGATECMRIVTKVAEDNIAARRLTEKTGFKHVRTQPQAFRRNGVDHDVRHYAWDFDDWALAVGIRQAVGHCAEQGQHNKGIRAAYRLAVTNNDYSILEG